MSLKSTSLHLHSLWSGLCTQVDTTQFFLRVVTASATVLGLLFIRLYLKAQSGRTPMTTMAEIVLFFSINMFGIVMAVYPWYLSVSNKFVYFHRLRQGGVFFAVITSVLVIIRSVLSPSAPFHIEDPEETSVAFRVVSTFYHISFVFGLFLLLPLFVRRRQFLSSHGSIYSFCLLVLPFVIIMCVGLVLHEWLGDDITVSYSPVILIVLYYVNKIVNEVKGPGGLQFDEVFIIAAGFVPIWLGGMLGKSLMEMSSRSNSISIIVVVSAWRVLIFLFEVITIEIGRKASRFNQESAFSFCVIYTGAIYTEFIFLSVSFNSLKFWALLAVEFFTIVLWQGGLVIRLQNWVVEYLNSDFAVCQQCKYIWLLIIGEMPPDIARKASQYKASEAPPDVKLALIRSRAIVVQTTWCQNDIKMSSEFQSLICASTAVACDMIYSYFDVGVEFITLSSTGKRELLYIYLVNLIVLMVAQAIAKYELSRQVVILKLDISEALNTVTASYQEKITNSAAILRQDLKYSVNTVNHLRIETGVKEYHTSKNIAEIVSAAKRRMSTHPMEFQRRNVSIFSMGNNPLWNNNTEVNITGDQIIEETTLRNYSTQADDLQDILDVTACLTTQMLSDGTPLSNRSRRRASGFMQTSFFEYNPLSRRRHTTLSDIIDDDGEVGWIDDCKVQRCPNRSDGNAVVHDDKTIEGYLQKKRSRGDSFDRCYCVLSHRKVLLFYQRKSKVSLHVSSSIGHFNLNSASEVRISECCLVITVSLNSERKSLIVQAYTSSEGMMWYKGLCRAVYGGHGYGNNIVGDALQNESVYSCCDQQSSTFYRSMIGCNGDYSATESCDMLPIHCGYLSQPQKNIFSSVEYKYCVLRRPGILYGYKSISGANSGGVESGKILVSMCDVLSVVQNNDDKSWFEIAIKDKTIKFEALSEKLATEWCNVIIMWTKYFTVIINASLQSTLTRPLQNNNEGTVSPLFASAVEMVKSRSCNLEKSNCTTDVVVISPAIEIVNQFYLVKTKTSSFAPSKWQRLWVSTEREGCLTIFAKRPTSHVDDICPQEVVQLSNIIAVDLCTINFCCVHIHEKGFHHEIKSDSLSDAMTLRTNLLSHIVKVHEENKTKAEPQAPLPMLPAVDTKAEIWEVLDSIINNVELDAYGMDAVEIEPFTRESSFFKPLGSGLNPLEVYLNQQSMKARRSIALDNHLEFVDMILNPVMIVDKVKESIEASRDRSDSYHDNNQFLTLNSNVDEDTFANKLKTQSYQDLNIEFWARHKWYLTAVVCFVTLNVLTITSYMIRETDF